MKNTLYFLSATFAILNISCASDSSDDLIPNEKEETSTVQTYEGSIKSIINQSCATSGCHNAATKQSGVDLSTYQLAKSGFSGRSLIRTEAGTMPPAGALPATTIAKIKNWVENDFQEK